MENVSCFRKRGDPQYTKTPEEMFEHYKEVKGLDPGEIYEFRVVSVDGKSMAFSDSQEIKMATDGKQAVMF